MIDFRVIRCIADVSILVFLELAPGLIINNGYPIAVEVFQSLFFWNSRPDAITYTGGSI